MIQVVADVVQHPPSPEQPLPFSALHFYLSSITCGVIINYVVVHYIFDLIFFEQHLYFHNASFLSYKRFVIVSSLKPPNGHRLFGLFG